MSDAEIYLQLKTLLLTLLQPCVDGEKTACEISLQPANHHLRALGRFTASLLYREITLTMHTLYRLVKSPFCSSRYFNLLLLGRLYDLPIAIYGNNFFHCRLFFCTSLRSIGDLKRPFDIWEGFVGRSSQGLLFDGEKASFEFSMALFGFKKLD